MANLTTSIPVYVTRKDAHGYTMTYSTSFWMPLFAMTFFFLNAIAWGILGLVYAFLTAWGLVF